MNLSDEEKRAAIEASRAIKEVAQAKSLEGQPESFDEMQAGSPRTPGYEPDYGQTMKDEPQSVSNPALAQSPSQTEASEFDKALEALQQGQNRQQDKGKDIE